MIILVNLWKKIKKYWKSKKEAANENDLKLINEKENESMIDQLKSLKEKYHNVEEVMKSFEEKIRVFCTK